MERLLCVKIASRGDLLLAAPAFRMLRERHPNALIELLVGRSCKDVAQHLPYFDSIQTIDDYALMGSGWLARFCEAWNFYQLIKGHGYRNKLIAQHEKVSGKILYSEVLIFHRDWRYGFLTWLARVPIRKGFYSKKGHYFLTHPYRPKDDEHHVFQYLKMVFLEDEDRVISSQVTLAGIWQFAPAEKERALMAAETYGFKNQSGNWVALGFGGGHNVKTRSELKCWPVDHYHHLAELLVKYGCSVVWVGDGEDAQILRDLSIGINLAGKLSVAETAAVLSVCQRVIANDTLILHLAEAMGVPTIGLFGPTDPAHYRPLGMYSTHLWLGKKLSCSPCHQNGYFPPCHFQHRCMMELSVESVFDTFLQKVEESK